jgi:histidine triad (HIT) family protein
MSTVFTKIIEGEIPGTFVYRDDDCVAFMSINPMAPGHLLVVPRAEIDHWIDLPADLAAHLFQVCHRLGLAQERAFGCSKVGMIIAGYEVPHAHIHLVPTNAERELSFANAAASVERSDLESWADAIRSALPAD